MGFRKKSTIGPIHVCDMEEIQREYIIFEEREYHGGGVRVEDNYRTYIKKRTILTSKCKGCFRYDQYSLEGRVGKGGTELIDHTNSMS